MTFARLHLDQEAAIARRLCPVAVGDLDLSVEDDQPRPLVDLMLGEALTGGEVEGDCARGVTGGQDLRQPWLEIQRLQLPALHDVSLRRLDDDGGPRQSPRTGRRTPS